MTAIIPPKLQTGDEIRVVAPARSLSILSLENKQLAARRLETEGLHVTFGRHCEEQDIFRSSAIASRVSDIHEAFADTKVKAIFSVIGGFNSNQLLSYLDYELIKSNPKILCGYSDITALTNAIYAKTGLVTYCGPAFANWAMQKGFEYTLEYFKKCLMSDEPFEVQPSSAWSDDAWFKDQENRTFIPNEGPVIIQSGTARGRIIGGNLCTLNLLQGTPYMPDLTDTVLLIEDDDMPQSYQGVEFDRDLQSLIHQPGFETVKGIIIGRFQKTFPVSLEELRYIIETKKKLAHIPVIANADFGHTNPMFTFPIGGEVELRTDDKGVALEITKH